MKSNVCGSVLWITSLTERSLSDKAGLLVLMCSFQRLNFRASNFNIPEQQSQVTEYENTEKSQETPQAKDSGHSQTSKDEQPLANISHAPRNRKRCSDTPIDKAIKQLKIISDDAKNNTEDEFHLFCRSLAMQLKRMPLHRALICQQKLQEVMVQERLQFINTSPHDSTRSSSLSHSSYTYVMSPDTYQHEQYPSSISQFQLAHCPQLKKIILRTCSKQL
ncbi:unnamed protein product [Parnassius apollo]|uniref:(apollo) hypothetical protein n=1 Tax=Parnassius apollo TaxID=110799 RepID=A0A8S3WCL2_PARAO|nr:unnamed protein product [Parnassius apollo]